MENARPAVQRQRGNIVIAQGDEAFGLPAADRMMSVQAPCGMNRQPSRRLDQPLIFLLRHTVAAGSDLDQNAAIQDADVAARRLDRMHAFENVQFVGDARPPDAQHQRQEIMR